VSLAPDIVLLAHGSPDPRHAAGVEDLAAHVREHSPGRPVHTAYLDHHGPNATEAGANRSNAASSDLISSIMPDAAMNESTISFAIIVTATQPPARKMPAAGS